MDDCRACATVLRFQRCVASRSQDPWPAAPIVRVLKAAPPPCIRYIVTCPAPLVCVSAGRLQTWLKREQRHVFEYELASAAEAAFVVGDLPRRVCRPGAEGVPSVAVHGPSDAAPEDLERTAGHLSLVFKFFGQRLAGPLPLASYSQVRATGTVAGWFLI